MASSIKPEQSVEAPFVTMKQARGALSREDYDAGNYYFDLGGSYDVNNNFAYVEGSDSGKKFSSDVKKNGYVRRVGSVAPAGAIQSIFEDSSNWDRGEVGFCAGGINTDARGLPRADRVKTEDPVSDCDIGAFEYNDYYQVDCWNEDGDRPENNIKSASMTWCMGADDLKNPKAIIENMGTFAWYWSLALLGVFFIRRKLV